MELGEGIGSGSHQPIEDPERQTRIGAFARAMRHNPVPPTEERLGELSDQYANGAIIDGELRDVLEALGQ